MLDTIKNNLHILVTIIKYIFFRSGCVSDPEVLLTGHPHTDENQGNQSKPAATPTDIKDDDVVDNEDDDDQAPMQEDEQLTGGENGGDDGDGGGSGGVGGGGGLELFDEMLLLELTRGRSGLNNEDIWFCEENKKQLGGGGNSLICDNKDRLSDDDDDDNDDKDGYIEELKNYGRIFFDEILRPYSVHVRNSKETSVTSSAMDHVVERKSPRNTKEWLGREAGPGRPQGPCSAGALMRPCCSAPDCDWSGTLLWDCPECRLIAQSTAGQLVSLATAGQLVSLATAGQQLASLPTAGQLMTSASVGPLIDRESFSDARGGHSLVKCKVDSSAEAECCPTGTNNVEYRPCRTDVAQYRLCMPDEAQYHPCRTDNLEYHPWRTDEAQYRPCRTDKVEYRPCRKDEAQYLPCRTDEAQYLPCRTDKAQYLPCRTDKVEYRHCMPDEAQFRPCMPDEVEYRSCTTDKAQYHPCTMIIDRIVISEEDSCLQTGELENREVEHPRWKREAGDSHMPDDPPCLPCSREAGPTIGDPPCPQWSREAGPMTGDPPYLPRTREAAETHMLGDGWPNNMRCHPRTDESGYLLIGRTGDRLQQGPAATNQPKTNEDGRHPNNDQISDHLTTNLIGEHSVNAHISEYTQRSQINEYSQNGTCHRGLPRPPLPPVVTPVRARGSSTTPITSSPSPSVPIRPPSPNGSQQLLRSTAQFLGVDLVRVTTVYIVGQLTAKSTKSAK